MLFILHHPGIRCAGEECQILGSDSKSAEKVNAFFFFDFTEDFELLKSTKDWTCSWTCSVHAVLPVTDCGGVRVFHGACLVEVAGVAPCCLASSPGFKAPGGSWFLLPSVTPGDPEFFSPVSEPGFDWMQHLSFLASLVNARGKLPCQFRVSRFRSRFF